VRATDRLTQQAADHKRRIKDLVRQLLPASPLVGELGQADLAVLERWADPHALVAVGRARLQRLLGTASAGPAGRPAGRPVAGRRPRRPPAVRRPPRHRLPSAGRRGPQRGPAAARHPGRAGRPRQGAGSLLPAGRPGRAGPQPARPGRDRWARPGRHHGQGQPLRHRGQVPLLHWPGPQGIRDRPERPQRPTHHQGRQQVAPDYPGPGRRPRPPPRPSARPHLLDPDGPARQRPPRRDLRGRRPPGRARLGGHGPRHALCGLRHRRHPGHPRQGQGHHRRAVDRARTGPPAATQQEVEAPQQVLTGHGHGAHGATRRPSPSSATLGQQPSRVKPTQPQP
jgi:hypothetical protein